MDIPENLYYCKFLTGSSYICNPPVLDTDIDTMYYVKDIYEADKAILQDGWELCGKEEYKNSNWKAYRKGKYNALITSNFKHYTLFEAATELAKKRNYLDKDDRIEILI